jgi:hypothetical protein
MCYTILAPFKSAEGATLPAIFTAMRERFRGDESIEVTMETDRWIGSQYVQLTSAGWSLRVHSEFEPHVLVESQEIAELYGAGRSDRAAIARCAHRVTIDSDDDPGMNHFNDYVFVLETLERLGAVTLFDPVAETFI